MRLPNWWAQAFTELDRLAVLLERRSSTIDTAAGLRSAIAAARAHASATFADDKGRRYRSMRLGRIPIVHPSDGGLHPPGAQLRKAATNILFECWDETKGHERFGDERLDRIRVTDVQVLVQGVVRYGERDVVVEDHWRVDTHHFPGDPIDPHPWTHYQRGGHAQDIFSAGHGFLPGACLTDSLFEQDVHLRGLMQTPAPRIACPPLGSCMRSRLRSGAAQRTCMERAVG
jgi:hypothetical protein